MRKFLIFIFWSFILFFAFTDSIRASTFTDIKDTWTCWGKNCDAKWVIEGHQYHYQHNLSDNFNFNDHKITETYYEIGFTNDIDQFDNLFPEFVSVSFDQKNWYELGEVDNGQYGGALGDWEIGFMNNNQYLDVWVRVDNKVGTAWIDHLKVSGEGSAVPLPGAFWLLGAGLLGLIGYRWKKPSH